MPSFLSEITSKKRSTRWNDTTVVIGRNILSLVSGILKGKKESLKKYLLRNHTSNTGQEIIMNILETVLI